MAPVNSPHASTVTNSAIWRIGSPCGTASSSSHEKRHDGEYPEHHVVNGSRHRVSGSEILLDRQAPKPEHEPEFRDEEETERNATHPKSGRRHGRHSKAQNCPPRRHNGGHEHDGRFH